MVGTGRFELPTCRLGGDRSIHLSYVPGTYIVASRHVRRAVCQSPETPQPRDCAQAAKRLHAESLREKAWGAHLAQTCQIPSLAAEIGAELDRLHPNELAGFRWDSEPFWVGHAMLDALIQLHEPLEAPVLASISQGFPTEGAILALQDASRNGSLFAALRLTHVGSSEWVAASNALARLRTPGFADALLQEVRIANWVWVSDTGELTPPGEAGSLSGGALRMRVPPGFPPVAWYRLTSEHGPGRQLVSEGTTPIYSQRTILDPGVDRTLAWPPEGYCLQCLRLQYLAELAQMSNVEVNRAIEPQTAVRWTNLLQLNAEISRALTDQKAAIAHLVKSLASAGALKTSQLGMSFHLEILIEDQRSHQSVPLPRSSPVSFQLM